MKSYATVLLSGSYVYMSQKLRWKKITRVTKPGAVVNNCILSRKE